MAAVQQMNPLRAATTVAPRRPQCTHITVDRAYGRLVCAMCGRVPDVGWLYRCQQDQMPAQHTALIDLDTLPVPAPPDSESDFYKATAQIAGYLGLSQSVVDGIKSRQYSRSQARKLVEQKQHVIEVINSTRSRMSDASPDPRSPSNVTALQSPDSAATNLRLEHGSNAVLNRDKFNPEKTLTCPFQVCVTCRPFFHDRMYASFESVLNGEVPQPSDHDTHQRPLMDHVTALTIGLRQGPTPVEHSFSSDNSVDITSEYIDDNSDDISVDWTPSSLCAESDDSSEHVASSQQYPCPGPGLCPVWSRYSGCAYDVGFDDGRRAINHGYLAAQYSSRLTPENSRSHLERLFGDATDTPGGASSTASSISLPTPATSVLASLLPTSTTFNVSPQKQLGAVPKAKSLCSEQTTIRTNIPLSRQQSHDSFGSEVEVHGGVALTEEAVRNSSPDILTVS